MLKYTQQLGCGNENGYLSGKKKLYVGMYEILLTGMIMKSICFSFLFLIKYMLIAQEKIIQFVSYLCTHSFPSLFYFYQ